MIVGNGDTLDLFDGDRRCLESLALLMRLEGAKDRAISAAATRPTDAAASFRPRKSAELT